MTKQTGGLSYAMKPTIGTVIVVATTTISQIATAIKETIPILIHQTPLWSTHKW